MSLPQVFILTFCDDPSTLYGATLTFNTLRVGFPHADVHVVDNASHPDTRPAIRQAAEQAGGTFTQLEQRIEHADFVRGLLFGQTEYNNVVLLDPDLLFWREVEHWKFDGALMAGRLIPTFQDSYCGSLTHARLHTSFLWLPDLVALRAKLAEAITPHTAQQVLGYEFDPIRPVILPSPEVWVRWDTAASLYHAIKSDCHAFTDNELDSYDHLFCGSHLETVSDLLPTDEAARFRETHKLAVNNPRALKGIWREQQRYFLERAPGKER